MAEASHSKRLSTLRAVGNKSLLLEDVELLPPPLGVGNFGTVYRGRYKGVGVQPSYSSRRRTSRPKSWRCCRRPPFSRTSGTGTLCRCLVCVRGDLRSLLEKNRASKWPPTEVLLRWSAEIASGVAFVHSKKVIHRDLRAQNVLVQAMDVEGKELAAKGADFGLAMPVNVSQRAKADERRGLSRPVARRWCGG
jgi:hypothetical protein